MADFTREEIYKRFTSSADFDEIFDAFTSAIDQNIDDHTLYRVLFWNDALTADEIILFGEKLVRTFPRLAYDVYMWMANVFEAIYGPKDNFEHAFEYYDLASAVRPSAIEPYIDACDCFDPDLNIPPAETLIEFLKRGLEFVTDKKSLCARLAGLYQHAGDNDLAEYYRLLAGDSDGNPPA
jgi:hypothetical protein